MYYTVPREGVCGGTGGEIKRTMRLRRINELTGGRFFAGWRGEWSPRGPRRRRARRDRVAFANAARRLASEYYLDCESLARQPDRCAEAGDFERWLHMCPRTYRHHHGTGDAARNAHSRALRSLWNFVCCGRPGTWRKRLRLVLADE